MVLSYPNRGSEICNKNEEYGIFNYNKIEINYVKINIENGECKNILRKCGAKTFHQGIQSI